MEQQLRQGHSTFHTNSPAETSLASGAAGGSHPKSPQPHGEHPIGIPELPGRRQLPAPSFWVPDLGPFRGFGTGRSCGVGAVLVFWDGRGLGAALFALLSAGLPLDMVNDRNKRGIHTVRGRLGSPRTPMIAFNSVIVTCLARSTAWATCCWCCGDRGARSATGPPQTWSPLFWALFCLFFPIFLPYFGCSSAGAPPGSVGRGSSSSGKRGSPSQPFGLTAAPQDEQSPCRAQLRPSQGFSSTQAGFKPHSSHPQRPQRDSALPARRKPREELHPLKEGVEKSLPLVTEKA